MLALITVIAASKGVPACSTVTDAKKSCTCDVDKPMSCLTKTNSGTYSTLATTLPIDYKKAFHKLNSKEKDAYPKTKLSELKEMN